VIGLGAAIDFINSVGLEAIRAHDIKLSSWAIEKLDHAFGKSIQIIGSKDATKRSSLISFALEGIHPHDLAQLLGESDICIRAGEHCAAPLHRSLHLSATARISFGAYTDTSDIDRLIKEMKNAREIISNSQFLNNFQ
jgi:cysteine desulfurase/selenocysteine lyase